MYIIFCNNVYKCYNIDILDINLIFFAVTNKLFEGDFERIMKEKVLDTRSLSDKVYDYLIKSIIDRKLKFGQIINIREIANSLEISPMPVRDAINRLALENIIKINPRSNCIINIPNKKNILELFEIREILEVYALKKYFEQNEKIDLKNLELIVDKMGKINKEKNDSLRAKKTIDLDILFHKEIVSFAKNSNMYKIYKEIELQISIALIYSIVDFPYEKWVYNDHKTIYNYLIKNSLRATEALKGHFEHIKNNIVKSEKFKFS